VLKIARASANEIWETNFLISCFKLLYKYRIFLAKVFLMRIKKVILINIDK